MKGIRTREEELDELKRRRKALISKADAAERKLRKMSPEHKNLHAQTSALNSLQEEIRNMDSQIMSEEAALGDLKRSKTRAFLGLKFGGLLECCEKGAVCQFNYAPSGILNDFILRLPGNSGDSSLMLVTLVSVYLRV